MNDSVDFKTVFEHLARGGEREQSREVGGVTVRMVRLAGGARGQWDRHDGSAETVIVWSGDFTVEFRDRTLTLAAGQCCVVPAGADHRGSTEGGAEIVLFQQAH